MDVVRALLVLSISILALACDRREPASAGTQFIKSGTTDCEQNIIAQEYLVHWRNGEVSVIKAKNEDDFKQNYLRLASDEIVYAEPHYRVHLMPVLQPQSPDWGGEMNWGVKSIKASDLWNKSSDVEPIVVAVIDSGLDTEHPQLQGVLAKNIHEEMNGLDDDGNGLIDDIYGYDFVANSGEIQDYTGHGTHVSGVIAAQHEAGEILGVAPKVKILPLNFIGGDGGGTILGAIKAIRYATSRGARVINASWGGNACSLALRDEVLGLAAHNILFVAAAGNSGNNLSQLPEYPAAFEIPNMITVGASTFDYKTAAFSNFGDRVDIMAPGANIYSTYPIAFDKYDDQQDGVTSLNGTSMAAPYVSAAAALLWQQKPEATVLQIKEALLKGASPGPFPVSTKGHLDVREALSHLQEDAQ